MGFNLGNLVGNILPFDPTPNFQLSRNGGALPGVGYDSAALQSRKPAPKAPAQQSPYLVDPSQVPSGIIPAYEAGGGGATGYSSGASAGGGYYDAAAAEAAANDAREKADTFSYLDDQDSRLQQMLGRTNTYLDQGISQINDSYNQTAGRTNEDQAKTLAGYQTRRDDTERDKQSAFGEVGDAAYNGYQSLRRVIGMSGSANQSALKLAAPRALAQQASQQRGKVVDTFGRNLRNIDTAENDTKGQFKRVLEDLLSQKNSKESSLRGGIEEQRSGIDQSRAQLAAQRAQANGGGYAAVKAAQAPFLASIDQRNASIDGLFNQFRAPAFQAGTVNAKAPDLSQYTVDRAQINAGNTGGNNQDGSPYSQLLRKKLMETA
ncbi:MAG: hypothetical protein JWN75_1111 [Candidatus Saccharibacteria bacterium]|nr:hypothetical protein [Candidatus Saccharibacteria bacterium]